MKTEECRGVEVREGDEKMLIAMALWEIAAQLSEQKDYLAEIFSELQSIRRNV